MGLYVAYIGLVLKSAIEHNEHTVGVPKYFQEWSLPWRPLVVLALFGYSGAMIFTAVEPFAHGLEEIGVANGIPEFFMIQWVAPLASESPELIVVAVLVNRPARRRGSRPRSAKLISGRCSSGRRSGAPSHSAGTTSSRSTPGRASEIWITAVQSFCARHSGNFEISIREAIVLFALFISQVVLEFLIRDLLALPISSHDLLRRIQGCTSSSGSDCSSSAARR